jgi:hypothetical protein
VKRFATLREELTAGLAGSHLKLIIPEGGLNEGDGYIVAIDQLPAWGFE